VNVVTRRALQHTLEHAEELVSQMERDGEHEMIQRCCGVQEFGMHDKLMSSVCSYDSVCSEVLVPECGTPRPTRFPRFSGRRRRLGPRSKRILEKLFPCHFNGNSEEQYLHRS